MVFCTSSTTITNEIDLSLRFPANLRALIAIGCSYCLLTGAAAAASSFGGNPEVEKFVDELVVNHQFDRRQLWGWFNQARIQNQALKAISSPTTARPWFEYRVSHVSQARIRGGFDYWQAHGAMLARASKVYGVPEEIIVATIGIETFYGRNIGSHIVFDALATLAFAYPPRAELFRGELEHFLLLTRELRANPLRYKGSYAGALGVPQFLPSSYRRHAVDFDNDGRRDLWNHSDAIGSIANYYKTYGWQPGEKVVVSIERPIEASDDEFKQLLERGIQPHTAIAAIKSAGVSPAEPVPDDALASVFGVETEAGMRYWLGLNNFYVITRYNRSVNYALAVYELSRELRRARYPGRVE